MFHGIIVNGKKEPATFWEKEWGTMNSAKYDAVIFNIIQAFLQAHKGEGFIWIQNNASCYKSYEI
jgi:hypothetical protein